MAMSSEGEFAALRHGYETGRLSVEVNVAALNQEGSPVYSRRDNVAPMLFLILLSLAFLVLTGWLLATVALGLGLVIYVLLIRVWIAERLRQRTFDLIWLDVQYWNLIWTLGGLVIALTANPTVGAIAPHQDWRRFIRKHKDRLYAATDEDAGVY